MKRTLLLILLMVINTHIFSEKYYEEELVHTFKVGKGENELGLIPTAHTEGVPETITFSKDGKLIISDVVNERIIYYNEDFSVHKIYDSGAVAIVYSVELYDTKDILWGRYYDNRIYMYNKNNGKGNVFLIPDFILMPGTILPTDRVLFYYDKSGDLKSYFIKDIKNLSYTEYDEDETMELFENKDYGLESLYLDDQQRIFNSNHEIQNRDFKTLYEYWDNLHKENEQTEPRQLPGVPPFSQLKGATAPFIGKDRDGNSYFSQTNCIVYDKDGWVLTYVKIQAQRISKIAVNSNGDLFFLRVSSDRKELYLYRIKRQW